MGDLDELSTDALLHYALTGKADKEPDDLKLMLGVATGDLETIGTAMLEDHLLQDYPQFFSRAVHSIVWRLEVIAELSERRDRQAAPRGNEKEASHA